MRQRRRRLLAPIAIGFLLILGFAGAAAVWAPREARPGRAMAATIGEPLLKVELRSWVVAGRGRHLYAKIIPPEGAPADIASFAGVVEYWSTAFRSNYIAPNDLTRVERIAKLPAGQRARPQFVAPDNRLEATYEITPAQARELSRDRVFSERYILLGPNSSSGLRAAFNDAGLEFPPHVLMGRGVFGSFPGVDLDPGREIPVARWAEFGLVEQPQSAIASR